MDDLILITQLNDFIFCPVSIYFHNLYGNMDNMLFQSKYQINGTNAHKAVDSNKYSSKKEILTGISIYCEKYRLIGKLDMFDAEKGILRERKKFIKKIYDGYIFQLYAQYFSLLEMGYKVNKIQLYSMDDNKIYNIDIPNKNNKMLEKFENVIKDMRTFNIDMYEQKNKEKCSKCIYEPACDRGNV